MAKFEQGDDPRDHSVAEINEYLADPTVSDEEKARVYAAEQPDNGGQGRTSVKDPNPAPAADGSGDQGSAANQTPVSDKTVTDGTQVEGDEEADGGETVSAYAGSKPYWYEETQGPVPSALEEQYTVVRTNR